MRSHRELLAWQRANAVAVGFHLYAKRHWCADDDAVIAQARRASLSVQLNIAEGFASGRTARSRNLFRIAYGSAVETTDALEFLVQIAAPEAGELHRLVDVSRETQALTLRLWQASGRQS